MAILPPDPVFCLKSDMGYVHSICFPKNNDTFTTNLLAATESGFVYIWDLEVSNNNSIINNVYVTFFYIDKSCKTQTRDGKIDSSHTFS